MKQELSIKELNVEDLKYLKKALNFGYRVLFFFALFLFILPCFCIYYILMSSKISEKAFPILGVIIFFGFWICLAFKGIKYTTKKIIREKRNLYLQKKNRRKYKSH